MHNFFGQIPFLRCLAVVTVSAIIQGALIAPVAQGANAPSRGRAGRTLAAASVVSSITAPKIAELPRPSVALSSSPAIPPAKDRFHSVRQFVTNLLSPWQTTSMWLQGALLRSAIVSQTVTPLEWMLAAGLNPNASDFGGVTPLMLAASAGRAEMLESLTRSGAQVDLADAKGWRALHYALASRKLEAVQSLLSANARVANPDVFPLAAQTRDWTFIEPVLERFVSRAWDAPARILFEEALRSKHRDHLRLLISKHRGAVTLEGTKDPLLAYAVVRNDLELVRLLLDAGADPNTTLTAKPEEGLLQLVPHKVLKHYLAEEPGMTLMTVAAGMGHAEMIKLLLAHGAEKNRPTKSKYRLVPLYFAAWGNHVKCLQALIDNAPAPTEVRIEISLAGQQATLYRNGVAVFRAEISSGQPEKPTPAGQFVVTDKKRYHVSNLYEAKMPFFMRLSCKDFGMHEGHLPGYPASHGCIRLSNEAARKLFREVPIGTLVTIR